MKALVDYSNQAVWISSNVVELELFPAGPLFGVGRLPGDHCVSERAELTENSCPE